MKHRGMAGKVTPGETAKDAFGKASGEGRPHLLPAGPLTPGAFTEIQR